MKIYTLCINQGANDGYTPVEGIWEHYGNLETLLFIAKHKHNLDTSVWRDSEGNPAVLELPVTGPGKAYDHFGRMPEADESAEDVGRELPVARVVVGELL